MHVLPVIYFIYFSQCNAFIIIASSYWLISHYFVELILQQTRPFCRFYRIICYQSLNNDWSPHYLLYVVIKISIEWCLCFICWKTELISSDTLALSKEGVALAKNRKSMVFVTGFNCARQLFISLTFHLRLTPTMRKLCY